MKTSIPRVRSITDKATGKRVRVLNTEKPEDYVHIIRNIGDALDSHFRGDTEVSGFVFMVWGKDGRSVVDQRVKDGSTIPAALVPDFVRNRLLADRIEGWTIDTINESRGYPPA